MPLHTHLISIRKELRTKIEVNRESVINPSRPIKTNTVDPSRVVQLSWKPRVFLYEGFLAYDESDHLISLAHGNNEILSAIGGKSGKSDMKRLLENSEVSTDINDDIVTRIEERISAWTFIPRENSKPLQVEHYGLENADKKYDYFSNKSSLTANVPLMATIVLYLSSVAQGGQILFPNSKIWPDCTKSEATLKPLKGNAILFFTLNLNTSLDKTSSHLRCPVVDGEMWYAIKTFHVKPINGLDENVPSDDSIDGECVDEDENCPQWAALGECQKNALYMTGSPDYYGTCRKSCNAC